MNTAAVTVTNLGEGVYYWMVQSYDAKQKESVQSEKNHCNMISTGTAEALGLELDPLTAQTAQGGVNTEQKKIVSL